jgi:Mce-associated membrane protein
MPDVLELSSVESEDAAVEPTPSEPGRLRSLLGRARRLPVLLAALAVLFAAAGGFFFVRYEQLATVDNIALLDTGATASVSGQVSQTLTAVLSYRFDDTVSTERAAAQDLTGRARQQYDQLFTQVRAQAPAQKLVLTTRVVSVGVTSMTGDTDGSTARLLVFVDQSATRGDNNAASASAAQLSVTATKVDGRWLVSDLQPR